MSENKINAITDERLRNLLVEVALEWERRFAIAPRITDAIGEYDAAKLVGTSIRIGMGRDRGDTAVKKGFDFKKEDTLYQVKSNRPSGKLGSTVTLVGKAKNFDWNRLIWILYDSQYDIVEAYQFANNEYKRLFEKKKRLSPDDMRKGDKLV